MKQYLAKILLLASCSVVITACEPPTLYKTAKTNVAQTQKAIQHDIAEYDSTPPAVVMHKGYYVNPQPVRITHQPKWMKKNIHVEARNLPFGILMDRILDGSGQSVSFDSSVDPLKPITLSYHGSVAGVLKRLESMTRYTMDHKDGMVTWSAFVTKTFDISFMPGQSNYLVGQSQNQHNQAGQQAGRVDHLNDMQYSNMQGQLSIWRDLSNTLNQLKSKEGQVTISESTTSVTVRDHPDNVQAMSHYITKLNLALSQEVNIRVQVVEVSLDDNYNFGIDWNVIQRLLHTQIALTGNMATATNLVATNLISRTADSAVGAFQVGKPGQDTSHFLLNALSKEGKVRVVTKPQVVTMNNQIASIRITQDTGYIQSITSSQFDQYQTTTITPGSVTDGFTLYLLPKIQGEKVFLQISSHIANLLSLQKVSNEPSNVENSGTSNSQYSAIEVPTVASKEFNQRSVIKSGSTLIIAGYKRVRDQTSNAKMFGVSALGGQGADHNNVETLVLITPTILQSAG